MRSLKVAFISLMLLCGITLMGCTKEKQVVEQIPVVMVAQPNTTHDELKSYAGNVQARQQTALAFRIAGQITERYVDVGDRIKVGQVLAKLDVQDAQLQLNAAQAQLDAAKSAAKIAEDEFKRFQQLLPINAVSRSQYDAVENQYKSAMSNLKQAQSSYSVSSNQTSYNQLVANKSGVITQRDIEIGQVVAAGQAAYQVAIDGDREVVIGIPEQAITQIKVGQNASVILWSKPEERFSAYVREISPSADQSRTFRVKVALKEGQSAIQLGQSARVFFETTDKNVLSIPLTSVSATENQPYVWVVNPDHTIRKTAVSLGAYGQDNVLVTQGLKATDWVVVGGVHLLRDKQKINPIDRQNRSVKIQTGAK